MRWSSWRRTYPNAKSDALISTSKSLVTSKIPRIDPSIMAFFRSSKVAWHSGVHSHLWSFFNNLVKGSVFFFIIPLQTICNNWLVQGRNANLLRKTTPSNHVYYSNVALFHVNLATLDHVTNVFFSKSKIFPLDIP